ncbi:MAG TPA: RluA family pseudouridine synthase, partial [Urbifossiella sp.]
LLQHGRVRVNGKPIRKHDHMVGPGDAIAIARPEAPAEPGRTAAIVFEDESVIAIDKPSGLLTVATESEKTDTAFARLSALLAGRKAGRPFVVHRLDRETSGLLLFARTAEIRDRLQDEWDAVEKTYLAVVEGKPRPAAGVLENHLTEGKNLRVRVTAPGGAAKHAVTRYRLIANHRPYSLVEVVLQTGRKHQIRVHLAGLGCPVIGDTDYGAKTNRAGRLGLHAWKLAFRHPVSGQRIELESPLPEILWKR